MLLELANGRDLVDALEAYARIDARTVVIVGARDWWPLPLRAVA